MEEYDDARFLGRNARGTVAVNVSCRVAALGSNPCGVGFPARPLDHQLYYLDEPIAQETYPLSGQPQTKPGHCRGPDLMNGQLARGLRNRRKRAGFSDTRAGDGRF